MGLNIRNFLEEKLADFNQFDNGKTAQTVRAQRAKAAPAQTVSRPKPQVGAQQQVQRYKQGPQVKPMSPIRSVGNFAKNVNDATFGTVNKKVFQPFIVKPTTDVTDSMGKAYGDAFGGGLEEKRKASEAAYNDLVAAKRTGNAKLYADRLKTASRVTGEASRYVNEATPNLDPVKQAANMVNLGLTAATAGSTPTLLRSGVNSTLGKKVLAGAANVAPIGAAFGATQAFIDNGSNTTAKDVAINTAVGTAGAAALGAAGPLAVKGASKLAHLPRQMKETSLKAAGSQTAPKEVSLSKLTSYEGAPDRARVDYYKDQITKGKDTGDIYVMKDSDGKLGIEDGKHRFQALKELGIKKARVREVTPENLQAVMQGGYIGGPKAKGFKDAQARGEVFDGVDGKPRFEVDDSTAKIIDGSLPENMSVPKNLSEVLDHPELFKNYPELANVKIGKVPLGGKQKGEFDPNRGVILVDNSVNDKGTLLHEIQHAIQNREGFASGTDASRGMDDYINSAGEAEARAVQRRVDMTHAERYPKGKATASDSLDVPKEDLIIRNGNESTVRAMSIDPERALNTLKDFDDVLNSRKPQVTVSSIPNATAARIKEATGIDIKPGTNVVIDRAGAVHTMSTHGQGGKKPTAPLTQEDIAKLPYVLEDPDRIIKGASVRGTQRIRLERDMDGNKIAITEVIKKGDELRVVTYFNDSSSGRTNAAYSMSSLDDTSRTGQLQSTNLPQNIAQNNPDVNSNVAPADNQLTAPKPDNNVYQAQRAQQEQLVAMQAEARRRVDELNKKDGRFIQSADDLPALESGKLKRKVQIANKQADEAIKKTVRDETDRIRYEDGALSGNEGMITPVRAAVRKMGGIASSDWEGLPSTVKNKNGRALDDVVGELNTQYGYNFEDGDDLAQALIDDMGNVPKGITAREARDQATKQLAGTEPIQSINDSRVDAITEALIDAKTTKIKVKAPKGKVHEYIAVENGDGMIQLKDFDDAHFKREDGVITDKQGKSVGTYVKVDGEDIIAYVGGKPMNITGITGNPNSWGQMNKVTHSMTRLFEENAPDKKTFEKTYDFVIRKKMENEAIMKTELKQIRSQLKAFEDDMTKTIPNGIKREEMARDLMRYGERLTNAEEIAAKYGPEYTQKMVDYDKWARGVYDSTLDRANKILVQYGKDPIPRRNNYYTHFTTPGFWESVGLGIQDLGVFGKGISADANPQGVRGGLPVEIAGQTDQFKPITKWNPFAQVRRGSYTEQDAFGAVDAYLEPIMFNIHMTEPAARARVIEKTFRAADKIRTEALDALSKELADAKEIGAENVVKDKMDAINAVKPKETGNIGAAQFVESIQEYANALAGKTNRFDRQINSMGNAGKPIMKVSGAAQRIVGANTIPGNLSSALAQTLSLPQTVAMNGVSGAMKGIGQAMKNIGHKSLDDPIRKSSFMRARYTDAESLRRGAVRKYTDAASIPLNIIERAFGEFNWYANYNTMAKKGFTGDELIRRTDMITEKTLSGRGIGDRPEAFRSSAFNTVLQFGLEVNNQRVQFWKEMSPAQKAYFVAGAYAMNAAFNQVTGNKYLPDYIDATVDEFNQWREDNDKSILDKTVDTGQRFAGETAKFVPGSGAMSRFALGEQGSEAVFGKGSDITRFDEAAFTKIPKAIKTFGGGVAKQFNGDAEDDMAGLKDIRKGVLSVVPTGNGINKLIEGRETLSEGALTDKNGKRLVDIDTSRIDNQIKGTLFGKYAINEVRDKFQKIDDGKKEATEPTDREKLQQDFFPGTDANTKLKDSAERVVTARSKYSADLPKEQQVVLDKYAKLSQDGKKAFDKTPANKFKRQYAELERDVRNGSLSEAQATKKAKTLARSEVESTYDREQVDMYTMSKTDLRDYIAAKPERKDLLAAVYELDNKLYNAGLIDKLKFNGSTANARTSSKGTSKSTGKKTSTGRKSSRGKFDYKLFGFSQPSKTNSKQLYDLLKKAQLKNA